MKKSLLLLKNISFKPSQIHKFRGYIANLFKDHDLVHNHDPVTGKLLYRYPLIQFKLLDNIPAIIAITEEAVNTFSNLFFKLDHIVIENIKIPVYEKNFYIENVEFGHSKEICVYEFLSPWIALNQKNFDLYNKNNSVSEKLIILKRMLIGNILSMSKSLDYWLENDQRIYVDLKVHENLVNLKGKKMIGFTGIFKTNFLIPDGLGIGKSASRGFGTVRRLM